MSKTRASLILSVLGVSNTVGRLAAGFLADRPWADSVFIHNVAVIVAGLLTCLVSVVFSFDLLCVYAALFGGLIGTSVCLALLLYNTLQQSSQESRSVRCVGPALIRSRMLHCLLECNFT